MKKLAILSIIALSGVFYTSAKAQVRVRVGLNFGEPVYAPAPVIVQQRAVVYDNDDYYYLPDVNAYYNVFEHRYYYLDADGDRWIASAYLPGEYRDYDWRSFRRYEIRGTRPYMHDEIYRARYRGHEGREWAREAHFDRGFRGRDEHFENRGWAPGRYDEHFDRGRHEGWGRGEGHR